MLGAVLEESNFSEQEKRAILDSMYQQSAHFLGLQ